MSFITLLQLRQSRILTKCLLEQYLKRYLRCQTKLYCIKHTNHKNAINSKDRAVKRKALKARILEDIKETRKKVEGIIERENIWTVPNLLCVGRMVTSPYLSYLILSQDYQVSLFPFL